MMPKYPITIEGFRQMQEEVKYRKFVRRPAIVKEIATARDFGDLKENAEYAEAKKEQSMNEGMIQDMEDKLARAEVIDVSKLDNSTVKFGATVCLLDDDTEEKLEYQIVSDYEADLKKYKISVQSPIAKALIGKKLGDVVEVITPRASKVYEVTGIKCI